MNELNDKYDYIGEFHQGVAIVVKDNLYGAILMGGHEIIAPAYDYISTFKDGYAKAFFKSQFKILNLAGQECKIYNDKLIVIPTKYDCVRDFKNGYACVKLNDKWGAIDTEGREIFAPQFFYLSDFVGGTAKFKSDRRYANSWGYVNVDGYCSEANLDEPEIEPDGNLIISRQISSRRIPSIRPDSFLKVLNYSRKVRINNKGELIVKNGNQYVKLNKNYLFADEFADGLAHVTDSNGFCGYVNPMGKIIVPIEYLVIEKFSENKTFGRNKNDKLCLISATGSVIKVLEQYDGAYSFKNGYAIVSSGNKKGLINSSGQEILAPLEGNIYYTDAKHEFKIAINGKVGYFNALTKRLVKPRYKKILEVLGQYAKAEVPEIGCVFVDWEGRTFIEDDVRIYLPDWCIGAKKIIDNVYLGLSDFGKWGLVNKDGETICMPAFDSIGEIDGDIIPTEVYCTIKEGGGRNLTNEHVLKYGLYNLKTNVCIPAQYDKQPELKDGYYLVENNGLYGVVDLNGKQILKPEWFNIRKCLDYFLVKKEVKQERYIEKLEGLTDKLGNIILNVEFEKIEILKNGLYKAGAIYEWGIYTDKGRLTEESYEEVSYDGRMINITYQEWEGHLDESGKKVIQSEEGTYIELPSKFSWGRDFENGIAEVLINGCKNLVDTKFNLVIKKEDTIIPIDIGIEYIVEQDKSGNYIFVTNQKYGLLSSIGEILIEAKYQSLSQISENRYAAAIQEENSFNTFLGVIDIDENSILPFEYSILEPFLGKIAHGYWTWDDRYVIDYIPMPNIINHWLISKNKYGLIDIEGNICIPLEYDDIQEFENGFFLKRDNSYEIVNSKYSLVSEKKYHTITSIGNGLYKVSIISNGHMTYGILDSYGKERLEPICTSIGNINEFDVATINQAGLYGLIDKDYNIIAKPIYEHISKFEGGKAMARKYDRIEGTIDTKGIFIPNTIETKDNKTTHKVKTLKNGLLVVKNFASQLCAIVDNDDNITLPFKYKHIDELENGMYKVSSGSQYSGKFGLLDKDFNEIVEPTYTFLEPIGNGFAISTSEGFIKRDIGFMNSGGKITIPLKYSSIRVAWGDMVWIYTDNNESIGLATVEGNILIEPYFGKVELLGNGYAKVNVGHWYNEENEYSDSISRKYSERLWGIVDVYGKLVVPTVYHSIEIESDGTFKVLGDIGYGHLNKEGKLVIRDTNGNYILADSRFDWQFDFDDKGYSRICCKERCGRTEYGTINSKGQFIISSKTEDSGSYHIIPDGFDWAYYCSEDTFIGVKNNKKGVYYYDGTEIISAEYDDVHQLDDIYIVRKDYQTGILSKTSKIILPLRFDHIEVVTDPYSDNKYYKCRNGSKYGLYNLDGSEFIPIDYKQITFLAHNLLSVQNDNGKFMIFNSKGTCVNSEYFEAIFDFGKLPKKENFSFAIPNDIENPLYAIVKKNGLFGAINALGATEISPKYKELYCVTRNVFCANGITMDSKEKKVAYLEDKLVYIPDEYNSGELLKNGLILVKKEGKCGCINQIGEIVIPVEYKSLKVCKNLINVSRNKENDDLGYSPELGVINFFNEVIIPFSDIYQELKISDNSILYKKDDKWGAFTLKGRLICDAIYDYIAVLTDNLIKVGINGTDYKEYNDYYWEDGERYDFTSYTKYSIINWGIIDLVGNEILPTCYREIYTTENDNFIRIQEGRLIGYADITGKILLGPKYTSIGDFEDGYSIVSKTSTYDDENGYEKERAIYGVIDYSFKEVIPCLFSYIEYDKKLGLFETNVGYKGTDGRYMAEVDGKVIFINKKYKYCKPFQDNCAIAVMCNDYEAHYGLIDTMSNDIVPPIFEMVESVDDGLYKFKLNKLYGIFDSNGNIIVPNKYHGIGKFSDDLACVQMNIDLGETSRCCKLYGYINSQGDEVLPVSYEFIGKRFNQLAVVMKDGIWGLFSIVTHTLTIVPEAAFLGPCINNLCKINVGGIYDKNNKKTRGGLWGYISVNGQIVIEPTYEEVYGFSEGMAAVKLNNKWGFINANGAIVIPCEYDNVEANFKDGKGKLIKNKEVFVFDKAGVLIDSYE